MKAICAQCRKEIILPDSASSQQGNCPNCGRGYYLDGWTNPGGAAAASPPPMPLPVPSSDLPVRNHGHSRQFDDYYGQPRKKSKPIALWAVAAIVGGIGAVVMLVLFVISIVWTVGYPLRDPGSKIQPAINGGPPPAVQQPQIKDRIRPKGFKPVRKD